MLEIITFNGDEHEDYVKYTGAGYIHLKDTNAIETEFVKLFNQMLWEEDEGFGKGPRPRFDSPVDLMLMKEIDHADRRDLLVVKTDIGTAPLTCLSTGCKFGLLVNYWTQKGRKIVASWGSAGENVFELLGRELDITIYMDKRDLLYYYISWDLKNIVIDGEDISEFEGSAIMNELGTVTTEKLKKAHRRMSYERSYIVRFPLSMQCDYQELNSYIGLLCSNMRTLEDYIEDFPFLQELHYNIRTTEINVDTGDKYPTIWTFRKINNSYKFTLDTIYKYPNFIDILCEAEDIYQADTEMEEVFMVVFDTSGMVLINREYPEYMAYSLVYKPQNKEMNVIGVSETIEKLEEIAENYVIEVEEECPRKSDTGED